MELLSLPEALQVTMALLAVKSFAMILTLSAILFICWVQQRALIDWTAIFANTAIVSNNAIKLKGQDVLWSCPTLK